MAATLPRPLAGLRDRVASLFPGVAVATVVAIAAAFLGEHYGAPVMLYALLLGMALHFLTEVPRCVPGIDYAAKGLLRIGIALLGARITLADMTAFGPLPFAVVAAGLAGTIGFGLLLARLMGRHWSFGMLTGGAVAICGASAALAISAALPRRPELERSTLFTVVAVTTLSTVAMILYPIVFAALGFEDRQIGILLGATIHDVAQVVGAGYAVSDAAGDTASFVKLLRVMALPFVVLALVAVVLRSGHRSEGRPPWPLFALAFLAILLANSAGLIPEPLRLAMVDASRWLLVIAIAALGIKTTLRGLIDLGPGHALAIVAQTLFLAALATALVATLS
jgi:uncharacterized integral membrane protein (TIGR00698 family)